MTTPATTAGADGPRWAADAAVRFARPGFGPGDLIGLPDWEVPRP